MAHPPHEQTECQVRRILQSTLFHNSHTLQQLLEFLVDQAYAPNVDAPKEYTIGVEVLHRSQHFDPKTDPIVRVQIHRLRHRLSEYYRTVGSEDPIVIELPKGHYLPTFTALEAPNSTLNSDTSVQIDVDNSNPLSTMAGAHEANIWRKWLEAWGRRKLSFRWIAFATVTAIAIFTLGVWAGNMHINRGNGKSAIQGDFKSALNEKSSPAMAFWATLIGKDSRPIIAYPDPVFLLDSANDLFRYRNGAINARGAVVDLQLAEQYASSPSLVARAGRLYYENGYTGIGELNAVAMLTNLFGQMGVKPIIEPGREITPDDLKEHTVILLGSSFQNFAVQQFLTMGDFSFKNPDSRLEEWRGVIADAHPRPGEASIYRTERDPVTHALTMDHALITIEPSIVPGRYIADFGGLDTTGTEGAVMFATSNAGIEAISNALAAQGIHDNNSAPTLFQALLSVPLEKGFEVLGASLVTVHPLIAPPLNSPSTP